MSMDIPQNTMKKLQKELLIKLNLWC